MRAQKRESAGGTAPQTKLTRNLRFPFDVIPSASVNTMKLCVLNLIITMFNPKLVQLNYNATSLWSAILQVVCCIYMHDANIVSARTEQRPLPLQRKLMAYGDLANCAAIYNPA